MNEYGIKASIDSEIVSKYPRSITAIIVANATKKRSIEIKLKRRTAHTPACRFARLIHSTEIARNMAAIPPDSLSISSFVAILQHLLHVLVGHGRHCAAR
jgi:hypothetical protein